MGIDEILSQYKNFIFIVETTDEDLWVFYFIKDFSDPESIWMDSVYGFHMKGKKDDIFVDIYAINLRMCYDYEKQYYSLRCLIGTILHELLHKYIHEEKPVEVLTKELMRNYKYSRIYIGNERRK